MRLAIMMLLVACRQDQDIVDLGAGDDTAVGHDTATDTATDSGGTPGDDSGTTPVDADGDGYVPPEDCDDGVATVYPGADEVCDGVDNDCDGGVDEGWATAQVTLDPVDGACAIDYILVKAAGTYDAPAQECGIAWYIACNNPRAVVESTTGVFEPDACATAQTSWDWPTDADTDGDGVAEPITTCGWLTAELLPHVNADDAE
jgi:hypothetical protein